MLEYLLKVAFWWFLSIVKFLITPFGMIFNPGSQEHWSWIETILVTSSGAALGVFIFFHAGEYIFDWWTQHFSRPRKVFTRGRRRIIRLKWKWGLRGLMLVSGLISVPVASLLAAKFYRHDPNSLPLMIIGFFCWSVLLTSIAYGIKILGLSI